MSVRDELPFRLRRFRKLANLTEEQVGQQIGKKAGTVSAWEHGRGQPDADVFVQLCVLYQVDISAFFYDQPHVSNLTNRELDLISNYRQLNETGQQQLEKQLNYLLQDNDYLPQEPPALISVS